MTWWVLGIALGVGVVICSIASFQKGFWQSLWGDLESSMKAHWLRLLGVFLAYFGPFIFFACAYMTTNTTESKTGFAMPFFVWLIGVPALAIYWVKLRKFISDKLIQMKAVNEVQQGAHYGLLVASEALKQAMVVATIAMVYCAVAWLETIFRSASTGILVFLTCASIGGILCILDSSISYSKPKDVAEEIKKGDNNPVSLGRKKPKKKSR